MLSYYWSRKSRTKDERGCRNVPYEMLLFMLLLSAIATLENNAQTPTGHSLGRRLP